MAFYLPLNGSPSFPTSKNSSTLKKYIYSKKISCFLCLCLNNIVCATWLWCRYAERPHSHRSYWTDHTNTFHRKITISVNFCWQAFSVTLSSPGSLPAAELGFSTAPKYKNCKGSSAMWIMLKGEPLHLQGPYHAAGGLKNTQHQPRCFFLYAGSGK